jgi:hypothetical protein
MFGWTRRPPRNPFESRTELWREVGLGAEIDRARAQRARGSDGAQLASEVLGAIRDARRRADSNGGGRGAEAAASTAGNSG